MSQKPQRLALDDVTCVHEQVGASREQPLYGAGSNLCFAMRVRDDAYYQSISSLSLHCGHSAKLPFFSSLRSMYELPHCGHARAIGA